MIEVNMNDEVKVKLTEFGREVLNFRHKEIGLKGVSIKEDEDGYYTTQLHDLMYTFGKYMYMGNNNIPFDLNIGIVRK
ncbi:hypothetical protein [Niameybacter massiliensis]|uniref:hypothetical protein n=1 Tax=Niameybacter massiliensis TaxID=1658108 RepID=UPI0006B4BE32|nr:hypothetical protein [Niameybacter massiliensis]